MLAAAPPTFADERSVGESRDRGRREERVAPIHRIVTLVATLGLFGVCFATWSTSVQVPSTNIAAVTGFACGLGLALATLIVKREKNLRRIDAAVLVVAVALLIAWATSTLYFQPAYGTDEAAFEQYAAGLLSHGHDPYGVDLRPALNLFRVPIQYATYLTDGSVASHLSYPAFPVLTITALLPVTHGFQTVVVLNVLALICTAGLLYALLPAQLRSLAALVVVGLPILFGYAVAGVNAIVMATLLVGVAHRWTRVGASGRLTRGDYARAICLGLAVSTQQLAWFVTPFVLVGTYLIRRGTLGRTASLRLGARYTVTAAATFLVVNAPFIAWNPKAWLQDVAAPVLQHAIPYGQGLIDVTTFLHLGGGNLRLYTYGAALVYAALLFLFAVNFRRIGRAAFVLPSVALYFPTRSLAEYFMTMVAVWVISAATTSSAEFAEAGEAFPVVRRLMSGRPYLRYVLGCLALAPAVATFGFAASSPQPLRMSIQGVTTNGQLQSVWRMNVLVTNRSGDKLRPHFAANYIGQATTYWNVLQGPDALAPHATAKYVLAAPNTGSMPGITTPFMLQAVTESPETISSTELFTPSPYSASISPEYVNDVQAIGSVVTVHVELRSPFGRLVRKEGVRVALGQLIYGQSRLIPAEAVINAQPQGRTPVYATTDSSGVATFTLRDDSPQGRPIYFQAWVQPSGGYPFGYSHILPILWAGPGG